MVPLASQSSYAAIVLALVGRGVGVPIPEDLTLLTAGFLCARGVCEVQWMLPMAWAGVLLADSLSLCAGRFFRGQVQKLPVVRWVLAPHRLRKAEAFYRRHGLKSLLAARFMPGFRTPLFFTAGTAGMPYLRFLAVDTAATLVSVNAVFFLGWYFPARLAGLQDLAAAGKWGVMVAGAAGVGAVWLIRSRKAGRSGARDGEEPLE